MDVDAYSDAHRADWERLESLLRRRRWSVEEADEAIALYRRTATDLSVVRSVLAGPGAGVPAVVARRPRPGGRHGGVDLVLARPAALRHRGVPGRARRVGALVGDHRRWSRWRSWCSPGGGWRRRRAWPPRSRRRSRPAELVDQEFASYYSSNPAASFAAQVWTNNALVAATCLITGVLLLPVAVGAAPERRQRRRASAAILAANGRLGLLPRADRSPTACWS